MIRWFDDLANSDAGSREAAKVSLMGMGREDLPALQKLVQERRPLCPSQSVVLKEIVTQIYLAGDSYDASSREGFLGIRPAEVTVGSHPAEAQGAQNPHDAPAQPAPAAQPQVILVPGQFPGGFVPPDPNTVYGILVMERMAGFSGARSLEDGDVILGIVERPEVQFHSAAEFSQTVRAIGAGEKAHFEVLRQGRVIRVEVILGPRPDDADGIPANMNVQNPMQDMLNRRKSSVNDFWSRHFAPLLAEGVG